MAAPAEPQTASHDAELTRYRDERKAVQFKLAGDETLEGVIRWFDETTIHIVTSDRTEITLFKSGILHYRIK